MLELQLSFNGINVAVLFRAARGLIREPGAALPRMAPTRGRHVLVALMRIGLSPISINSSWNRIGYKAPRQQKPTEE